MQTHPDNMKKVQLYLSLGSNQGNREQNIEYAISMLNIELKTPYKAVSSLIETEPWGFDSDEKFLNAVIMYEIVLPKGYNPEAEGLMILEKCKMIERKLGRTGEPQYDAEGKRIYESRPIDIDILAFERQEGEEWKEVTVNTPELVIPHPQLQSRDFAAKLYKEIKEKKIEKTRNKKK